LAQYVEEKVIELHLDKPKQERKYHIKQPEKVLVRLNVDDSDSFPTLDNQKFGSTFWFVDEVVSCLVVLLSLPI